MQCKSIDIVKIYVNTVFSLHFCCSYPYMIVFCHIAYQVYL